MELSELRKYPSIQRWMSRLGSENTRKTSLYYFRAFYQWTRENQGVLSELNPDEMIEYQKQTDNGSKYNVLDVVQDYILSLKGKRVGYKKVQYSHIKSFFSHNRAELPREMGFRITGDVEKVRGTLTVEEIRDVVLSSKPVYQAAFLSMFQGGMGTDELVYWSNKGHETLLQELRNNPEVIRIDLPGRKKSRNERPYYTLIGGDAIHYLKNWLHQRPEEAEAIFVDQRKRPLTHKAISQYWYRHCKKLGLIKPKKNGESSNRYGKNLHEMRDVFRSQWEKSGRSGNVAEYLMGHMVDPLDYNKAFRDESYTKGEYLKALLMLQIMSSGEPFGRVEKSELERLRQENRQLREASEANEMLSHELVRRIEILEKIINRDKHNFNL